MVSNIDGPNGGVIIENTTNNKSKKLLNIRLSSDKRSIIFDLEDENGDVFNDVVISSNVELPELPNETNGDDCCDWDGWFDSTMETIREVGTRAQEAVKQVAESLEHLGQHLSGMYSDCPEGTGRVYGYDENGKPYSRCE
ncbi:MAG: hypothetical protein ACQESK_06905 [Bacteroidota bacterium]